MTRARAAAVTALFAVACARTPELTFQAPPSEAATAPAKAPAPASAGPGRSAVRVSGALAIRTTRDFQCSFAIDDFFVRGELGELGGLPVYVSINVERFLRPGRYVRTTQVLVRRVSDDSSYYASWYDGHATMTVLPGGEGATLEPVTLTAEPGGRAHGTVRIDGRFACARHGE